MENPEILNPTPEILGGCTLESGSPIIVAPNLLSDDGHHSRNRKLRIAKRFWQAQNNYTWTICLHNIFIFVLFIHLLQLLRDEGTKSESERRSEHAARVQTQPHNLYSAFSGNRINCCPLYKHIHNLHQQVHHATVARYERTRRLGPAD